MQAKAYAETRAPPYPIFLYAISKRMCPKGLNSLLVNHYLKATNQETGEMLERWVALLPNTDFIFIILPSKTVASLSGLVITGGLSSSWTAVTEGERLLVTDFVGERRLSSIPGTFTNEIKKLSFIVKIENICRPTRWLFAAKSRQQLRNPGASDEDLKKRRNGALRRNSF